MNLRYFKWFIICRKQLCGPGETIQSYNHQTYHKPQLKYGHHHHEDDIDVGKAGDEVVKLEGNNDSDLVVRDWINIVEFGVVGSYNFIKYLGG